MKIIHIVSSIDKSSGGPARSVTQTCEHVSELCVEIEIVTQSGKNPVSVNTTSNFKIKFLSIIELVRFSKSLTKSDYSLIHLQHIWEPYIHIAARFARKKGIPYIITPRGMLEPWIMNHHPWKKKLAMWLYQRKDIEKAAYLHATCEMEKEHIRKLGFKNPIVVIPNGIEISHAKQKTLWQPVKQLLFLSRVHPKKGIELLIDAIAAIHQPDIRVTIAGEGEADYIEKLKKQMVEKGVESQFHFVGGVYGEDKWTLYQQADLFVLPTYSENFGIVVAEALATGIPVITTTGTPWQELETEKCGWWIDLTVQNLIQSITEATQCSSSELKAMGERGRSLVEQKYDIRMVAANIHHLYKWILKEETKPEFEYEIEKEKAISNDKNKIIHFIISIDTSGGGTTAYLQLLSAELKQLVDVVVVSGVSAHPVELEGVALQWVDLSLVRWFRLGKEFRNMLVSEKPDVVHINGIWMPQSALFQQVAQGLGIKVVLSPHGMLEPYILNRHPLKKKIALALYQHRAIKQADYLHATAQSELDQIRKLGYMQPAVIVPNGIEIRDLKPKTSWQRVKQLLFLSRVHPKKGIELLIDAIAAIHQPDIRVTIAGEGEADYIEKLKKQMMEKGVESQFHFVGGVYGEDKWTLYQQADLFVLPTYSENFGIVVAEALATGIPVITTTGTPWQELETEQCGWWIDLTVDNLVKVLTEAIHLQPEELQAMGARGRKLVEDKYSIEAITLDMKSFYNEIVRNK